ncbi:MAG: prolipoprotein diacylglyceryl transferase [Planctomycetales bacterium]|nr:prolipoprotein diacylglyceryl transferase [Planctomycetales bacterium]
MTIPSWPPAYPLAMLLGVIVFLVVRRIQPRSPEILALSFVQKLYLSLVAFIGGTFGSKLPFVIVTGTLFSPEGWLADGKTITVALVGAYLAVEIAKPLLGIRLKTGDDYALPLAAAMAIGRWGCFFNGCCYGAETSVPWAVRFETVTGWRHPVAIYESAFHLAMFLLLCVALSRDWWPTHRLQAYLIAYCIYRWCTEFIRPEPSWAAGMTSYQWIVLGFGAALALQWWWETRRLKHPMHVDDPAT